ncbi:hypothetical protein EHI8A_078750 [Entamoeba histolytica HM-1:IMSS-B]|uniref:Uncharacterized protein n=6 Tax=Entamoeba histolytica TaxID=5759 RepID=C4LWM1_ENTH1|nr:hypothetical protein EHI_069330 [Entamoeba histolytica HM-1:IMSS]EMD47369.1 Hypothetical protein EHI5A_118340 [Entamoeba histolytica KU27]EMH76783.1 hypothetical protein EHI8A_078750 [Entamoeba histolytica HM-1:IMSS-B]EMS17985.1 hypothetical protein KM1_143440 [Entamoeba histolytica HM-3:IMSS]ENY64606.1 hypothetical protein EHI7A_075330 [Entamoeba histolytica HM-1:IMSS-A]GAT93110.1 hypothetical protein CL6EHI_069330 [Entamoeba histolytica]|eukprot:XP_655298.1 hypothetical protein EHI_069330 [Entamoeba histolytica HM-1:IMSS]
MKRLERVYLMNVIFYLQTIDELVNFLQISKNCYESFQMMHTNPNYSLITQTKELQIFKNCSSLQTVNGELHNISTFECNFNAIVKMPEKRSYKIEDDTIFYLNELIKYSSRIIKLKLITNRSDFEIHWITFNQLNDLTIEFYGDNYYALYVNYENNIQFPTLLTFTFLNKWNFEELKQLQNLKRICIKSINLGNDPPQLESLIYCDKIIQIANKKRKIYFYGNKLNIKSPNKNVIIMSNSLTEDIKTISSKEAWSRIDKFHFDLFIRDWKKYYPMKTLFYLSKPFNDLSSVNSLVEIEIGSSMIPFKFILPKNIKKITVIGDLNIIDISLCSSLELKIQSPDISILPSKKEIISIIIDCPDLIQKDLTNLRQFESLKTLVLNNYSNSIILPDLPGVNIIIHNKPKKQYQIKPIEESKKKFSHCLIN